MTSHKIPLVKGESHKDIHGKVYLLFLTNFLQNFIWLHQVLVVAHRIFFFFFAAYKLLVAASGI